MSLIDPTNPATGGVRLQPAPVEAADDDPFWCVFDPRTGAQFPRSVTFEIMCDEAVTGRAEPIRAIQNTTNDCQYTMQFRSARACGIGVADSDRSANLRA